MSKWFAWALHNPRALLLYSTVLFSLFPQLLFIYFFASQLSLLLPPQFQPLLHYKNSSLIMPSRNRWPRQVAHLYTHKTFKQKQNGGNMTGSFFRDFPSTPPHLLQCPASSQNPPPPPPVAKFFLLQPAFLFDVYTITFCVSLSLSFPRVAPAHLLAGFKSPMLFLLLSDNGRRGQYKFQCCSYLGDSKTCFSTRLLFFFPLSLRSPSPSAARLKKKKKKLWNNRTKF